jgi:hypothetical protein
LSKSENKKKKAANKVEESSLSSIENDAQMSVPSPISAPSVISNADSSSVSSSIEITENKASECQVRTNFFSELSISR